jgi:hypothetical protein
MTAPPTSFLPTTIGNIAGDVPHDPANAPRHTKPTRQ